MVKRVLIGLLCLVVVAAGAVAVVGRVGPSPRVYAVDEVQAGLNQQPRLWAGRTILVRGWSTSWGGTGCPAPPHNSPVSSPLSCGVAWLMLTPTFPYAGSAPFPVLLPRTGPDPTHLDLPLSVGMGLHALPIVGPTLFRWSGSRTLRIKLTTSNGQLCGGPPPCPGEVLVP
jgi:hypothetical protein